MKLYNASPEHAESIRVELSEGYGSSTSSFPDLKRNNTQIEIKIAEDSKRIVYLVKIIEDEGERIVFTTFDLKYAEKWCNKANKMIEKWTKYYDDMYWDSHEYSHHYYYRTIQLNEVKKAVIVKTELR